MHSIDTLLLVDEAARQMALAFEVAREQRPSINWSIARNRQLRVMGGLWSHSARPQE